MPLDRQLGRRGVLGAGFAASVATLAGCGDDPGSAAPGAAPGSPAPARSESAAVEGTVAAEEGTAGFGPSGSASASAPAAGQQVLAASYSGKLVETLNRYLVPTADNPKRPGYAGAVVLVDVDGKVTTHASVGYALRYGAGPVELAEQSRVLMRPDSIFDVASVTKVYTTILAMRQVDRGKLDLGAPVVQYLPAFDGPGKSAVTVRTLLTHTSGLPVGPSIPETSKKPDVAARWAYILSTPLADGVTPGSLLRYTSLGLLLTQQILEKLTGKPLDQQVKSEITGPLGLRDTGFKPLGWLSAQDKANRLAATDARSSRGLLRGVVHDDICNVLGGVAGSAGIFTTAADLAVIGRMLLGGGQVDGKRILSEATVQRMLTNYNAGLPAADVARPNRTATHGLGVELDQPWFMGRLASPRTFGHTGFTGCELVVEPRRRLVLVLLTNRAHPNWSWADPDPTRVAIANILADAIA
ncbi:serine hydrolase domain-containing protein [Dactylosporangium sp. NPDC051484]|uniref:serine hydrolase domain-containing protein n=1 Tax=Dactylosporangium sp. NPDC051484 TaxID=3154942 RepID=UPI00344EBA33